MYKQYLEYKEMKQLRKDHRAKQQIRLAVLVVSIMALLLITLSAIDAGKPVAKTVSAVPVAVSEELSAKQEQYCFRVNDGLSEPSLTQAIEQCLTDTTGWTVEDFDANMPDDPIS